ncbi:MAG: hypothetical protein LBT36_03105 [Oscillospiraceae bacterium]|jgi:homocitrate synthase NifV|nr:hypothetical protein [Oscillospiraceae bacterium]
MIRITDRTLSCLDAYTPEPASLARFLRLLIELEPDVIELSERAYGLLTPLPDGAAYLLRLDAPGDAARYPELSQFVCRNAPDGSDGSMLTEIVLNDMREANTIARYSGYARLRICGLEDLLLADCRAVFRRLGELFPHRLEYCPTDGFRFASALAAEWASFGAGGEVVTAFGGIGGFAPTEEVVLALRLLRARRAGRSYAFLPEMAAVFEEITGRPFAANKPILGAGIFRVESGVHVDGISKQPKCYEPFPPETVGQRRRIILGKQSGLKSVRLKLAELGLTCGETRLAALLARVKAVSDAQNRALGDDEFAALAREFAAGESA